MLKRAITAICLFMIAIVPFVYGGIPLKILFYTAIVITSYEVTDIFKNKWPMYTKILLPLFTLGTAIISMDFPGLALIPLVLLMIVLIILMLWDERFTLNDITLVIFLHVIFVFALLACTELMNINHLLLLYVGITSWFTDMGAYFVGVTFGKHRLNERISPKKSIEGSIGGLIIGTVSASLFVYFFMNEIFSLNIIILSLILSISGQIGDLLFSAIKRNYSIKDFGKLLPGHGGVLDRIDSLTFNYMIIYVLIQLLVI